MRILAYLKMIEKPAEDFAYQAPREAKGKTLKFSSLPASSACGIIRFLTRPGEFVKKDRAVAKIYNAFGKLQDTLLCKQDGVMLGHSDFSVAFPGAPVMAFGVF
jgi:predicted deacylase